MSHFFVGKGSFSANVMYFSFLVFKFVCKFLVLVGVYLMSFGEKTSNFRLQYLKGLSGRWGVLTRDSQQVPSFAKT